MPDFLAASVERETKRRDHDRFVEGVGKKREQLGKIAHKQQPTQADMTLHAIRAYPKGEKVAATTGDIVTAVKAGDLSAVEEMLVCQAVALNEQFHHSLQLAATVFNPERDPTYTERVTRLAFKAQEQSRKTLQTLIELKNPKRATFIKHQQNVLRMEQQREQQLEASQYAQMDTRSATKTERGDRHLATVEVEHGAGHASGQTTKCKKCAQKRAVRG